MIVLEDLLAREICKQFRKAFPSQDISICGSISMIKHGVLNRRVHDIDLYLYGEPDLKELTLFMSKHFDDVGEKKLKTEEYSGDKTRMIKRFYLERDGKFIDFFWKKDSIEDIKNCDILYDGDMSYSSPRYAIEAKFRFIKQFMEHGNYKTVEDIPLRSSPIDAHVPPYVEKHASDIITYNKWSRKKKLEIILE